MLKNFYRVPTSFYENNTNVKINKLGRADRRLLGLVSDGWQQNFRSSASRLVSNLNIDLLPARLMAYSTKNNTRKFPTPVALTFGQQQSNKMLLTTNQNS